MRKFIKLSYYLSCFVFLSFSLSCTEKNGTEPESDKQNPMVEITYPVSNSVVGDTLTIRANATDNVSISKVEFYIDDIHQENADDNSVPFEFFWNLTNLQIGSSYSIFAKAYDDAENIGFSDTINVFYKWRLLHQDENEPFPRDIDKFYVRSTSSTLEFRVETNDIWNDPHNIDGGIDCAIFLDTDQNPNTGLKPDTSYWFYQVNDIGADFVAVVGYEGDSLWNWNSSDTTWEKYEDFNYLNLENNSNYFEVGINLSDLGNPTNVDIVSANISFETDSTYWDWSPNESHLTYEIDGLYLGETNYNVTKAIFNEKTNINKQSFYFISDK